MTLFNSKQASTEEKNKEEKIVDMVFEIAKKTCTLSHFQRTTPKFAIKNLVDDRIVFSLLPFQYISNVKNFEKNSKNKTLYANIWIGSACVFWNACNFEQVFFSET